MHTFDRVKFEYKIGPETIVNPVQHHDYNFPPPMG